MDKVTHVLAKPWSVNEKLMAFQYEFYKTTSQSSSSAVFSASHVYMYYKTIPSLDLV